VGAIVVEPIQGRGGVIVPPDGFLTGLRAVCDETGVLLILDEIYTGFGRTGTMFACEREGVAPDLLCIGKALGGGVPLSATIGTARVMDAWPPSTGEALHTSTFLGNPLACAAALANLEQLAQLDLVARVRAREPSLAARLRELVRVSHGARPCAGAASCGASSLPTVRSRIASSYGALALGIVLLQSGPTGTSITIAPPLTIDDEQLARGLTLFERAVQLAEESR